MLPRTQTELNRLLCINERGDWMAADTLEVWGALPGGYIAKLTLEISGDHYSDTEFVPGMLNSLAQNWGFAAGAIPVNPVAKAATQQAALPAASPDAPEEGGCHEHGLQFRKPAYRGPGYECGGSSETQQAWTKDKPATLRDGAVRWFCRSRWQ